MQKGMHKNKGKKAMPITAKMSNKMNPKMSMMNGKKVKMTNMHRKG